MIVQRNKQTICSMHINFVQEKKQAQKNERSKRSSENDSVRTVHQMHIAGNFVECVQIVHTFRQISCSYFGFDR